MGEKIETQEVLRVLRDPTYLDPGGTPGQATTEPQRLTYRTFLVDVLFRQDRLILQFHTIYPTTRIFWEEIFPATLSEQALLFFGKDRIQDLQATRCTLRAIDSWYFHAERERTLFTNPEERALQFLALLDHSLPSPHPPTSNTPPKILAIHPFFVPPSPLAPGTPPTPSPSLASFSILLQTHAFLPTLLSPKDNLQFRPLSLSHLPGSLFPIGSFFLSLLHLPDPTTLATDRPCPAPSIFPPLNL